VTMSTHFDLHRVSFFLLADRSRMMLNHAEMITARTFVCR